MLSLSVLHAAKHATIVHALEHSGRCDASRGHIVVTSATESGRVMRLWYPICLIDRLVDPVVHVAELEFLWVKLFLLANDLDLLVIEGSSAIGGDDSFFKVSVVEVDS